ncbi:MAG: radical SAM family heme chaperone HemW [Oscillospiraceae bacterium]|jgi:oxygen-independent coproporphyrinogen-3 oxidase|nr:radical SAM family heme chaperone HemW [Oscillospiraceae bacterium]
MKAADSTGKQKKSKIARRAEMLRSALVRRLAKKRAPEPEAHKLAPLGVYVHIPFCKTRCAYCDFYSTSGRENNMWQYVDALRTHIGEYAEQLDNYLIDTVYFGGGTPSLFGAARLIAVLDELKRRGHVSLDAEITLEANPESVSLNDLRRLRRAGFNRISIGIQSAKESYLSSLGRAHSFKTAERAVKSARAAGFRNVSVDIMYGLPNQSREDFADDLLRIAALNPDHISCYGLKLEEGTAFYVFKDSPFLPDDDVQADMYLYAADALGRFGYYQYEVSNFARRGFESRHNLKYWLGQEYLGFGPSASSYIGCARHTLVSDLDKYINGIKNGGGLIETTEEISDYELLREYIMLRLRTIYGISEEEYRGIYNVGMERIAELLAMYEEQGWALYRDGRWRFTAEGFLLSNTLIGELLDAQRRERIVRVAPWQTEPDFAALQTTLFPETELHSVSNFI